MDNLINDLGDSEVAAQAHGAGETESAAHGAANLGRDTEGMAAIIWNKYTFDEGVVRQPKGVFYRSIIGFFPFVNLQAADARNVL